MGNIFRGFNRLRRITSADSTNRIELFSVTPILNRTTTAYLTDFQLFIDINSLTEFTYVPNDTLTDSQQNEAYRQASIAAQKKLVAIEMNVSNEWVELFRFAVYNKQPYYQVDCISRLTEQSQLLIGENTKVAIRMIDSLSGSDSITILINGTEETFNPFESA